MNTRDLKCFEYVCRTKSFTKAAKKLFISQPSITNAINRLELELNSKLIIRNKFNNEIQLTESGYILRKHTKNIFNEIDELVSEINKLEDKKIKLGIPPIIGAYFFPLFISELVEKNLFETIELIEEGSLKMNELLLEGKVDIALIGDLNSSINDDLIESTVLSKDKFMVCLNQHHPLSFKKIISFKELANESFIVLGNSYLHSQVLNELLQKYNIEAKKIYHTENLETAKSLIASGVGVGIMINMAIEKMNSIKIINLDETINFSISIASKKEHYLSYKEKKIIQTIIEKNLKIKKDTDKI